MRMVSVKPTWYLNVCVGEGSGALHHNAELSSSSPEAQRVQDPVGTTATCLLGDLGGQRGDTAKRLKYRVASSNNRHKSNGEQQK